MSLLLVYPSCVIVVLFIQGACEAVVNALQNHSKLAPVCEAGFGAVCSLAANNMENCKKLGTAGACEMVVSAL